jgi:nucleotide-binding universal stress UspA family protein
MPLGRVLIPVDGTRLLEAKLDWALALVPRFEPTIDVTFLYGTVAPLTVDRSPFVGVDAFLAAEDTWLDRTAGFRAVRSALQEWAERRQVPFMRPRKDGGAFLRLIEVTENYSATVEEQGRVSDLIVVGQPGEGMTALEAEINRLSLMTTGRRMAVIPTEFTQSDDILACNGINATFIADEMSFRVGRKILQAAEKNAATLVCLGAYEHPRVVELVIGGNTRHLYGRSKTPLIVTY